MLPDNFDFAQLPDDRKEYTLKELGMLASRIEDIDYAIVSWLKEDLDLTTLTNEGNKRVPVLWQTPERSFQIKNDKDLRHPVDDGGARKVMEASLSEPAAAPVPHADQWVAERHVDGREQEEAGEPHALGDSARHDGRRGRGEDRRADRREGEGREASTRRDDDDDDDDDDERGSFGRPSRR